VGPAESLDYLIGKMVQALGGLAEGVRASPEGRPGPYKELELKRQGRPW